MQLRHIQTGTGQGTERAWKAVVDLGQTTLIVGRNATGKSKVLFSIRNLAQMIANRQQFDDAHVKAFFDDPAAPLIYELHIDNGVVRTESLQVAAETVLTRSEDGQGTIKAIAAGVKDLTGR